MNTVEKILLALLTIVLWILSSLKLSNLKKDLPFSKFKYGQRFPVEPVTKLFITLKTILL
jgi:hypothetical protein